MEKQFSIAEAKSKLPSLVHSVEKGPAVQLTRHGKPVAVLLSVNEYEKLHRKKTDFWNKLSAFRKSIESEQIEITEGDFKDLRDTSHGRKAELIQ